MKNIAIDRLKNKLKLWETPGFSQFLDDLGRALDNPVIHQKALGIKIGYELELEDLEENKSKFKQGKLDL